MVPYKPLNAVVSGSEIDMVKVLRIKDSTRLKLAGNPDLYAPSRELNRYIDETVISSTDLTTTPESFELHPMIKTVGNHALKLGSGNGRSSSLPPAPELSSNSDSELSPLFSPADQSDEECGGLGGTHLLQDPESAWSIGLQVCVPFLIAGCGTVGAGLVLDTVQHWPVFTKVPQIFVLVPALLGLKGNLEMTLASRLSTLANLGKMDCKKERMRQIISNMALIQAQAAVVAFLAAVFAVILGWIPKGEFSWQNAMLLTASGLITASLASLILGAIMVVVVILSRHLRINPDNVATPIAASLGDLTTLTLLASIGSMLYNTKDSDFWMAPFLIACFILLCPLWIWVGMQNPSTLQVLKSGWSPVIFSMLISSAGGFILEFTVSRFRGVAVFQPVINGIGGNLVAVQASRQSTSLHQNAKLGQLPKESAHKTHCDCCETYCASTVSSTAARVLLMLVVPGHLIFMYMINFLRAGHTTISPMFALVYLSAAGVQVALLLFICNWMVHCMWRRKIDPDNSAIPYLTALGDLLGTALLALAFQILFVLGDKDSDIGE